MGVDRVIAGLDLVRDWLGQNPEVHLINVSFELGQPTIHLGMSDFRLRFEGEVVKLKRTQDSLFFRLNRNGIEFLAIESADHLHSTVRL